MPTLRSGIATSVLALTLLGAPASGSAAGPPDVSRITVVKRSLTTAVITASVRPRGSATSVTLSFGKTAALGTQSSPVAVTAGGDPVEVTMTLDGLKPDTTYYYRFKATNAAGTTKTAIRDFDTTGRTPGPPPSSEPLLMPRARVSFAIETIRAGRTIGKILATTRPRGLPSGTKVSIRCHSGCTGGRSFRIRAGSPSQYRFHPPIRITSSSVIEIRAVREGYVGRIQRASFSRSGVLISSRAVLNTCLSATKPTRIIDCPE